MKQLLFSIILFFVANFTFGQDSVKTKPTEGDPTVHEITKLTKKASSGKYGLTGEMPVKVGKGKQGGPANQRTYLDLLRDEQGKPVKYQRVGGGCCPYKSANALFGGYAMVDTYEVVYKKAKNLHSYFVLRLRRAFNSGGFFNYSIKIPGKAPTSAICSMSEKNVKSLNTR